MEDTSEDGAISRNRGLWQAYVDGDTKRVFWKDMQTGAISWHVQIPDPSTLEVRSFSKAKSSYQSKSDLKKSASVAFMRPKSSSEMPRPKPDMLLKSGASAPNLSSTSKMRAGTIHSDTSLSSENLQGDSGFHRDLLVSGIEMNKHRSMGAAKRRFIVFSNNWDRIMWAKSRREFLMGNILGRIMVVDMVEVRQGFDRTLFKLNFDKPDQSKCCFILQAKHRTLNLETDKISECNDWVTALNYVITKNCLSTATEAWADFPVNGVVGHENSDRKKPSKLLRTMTFWRRSNRESRGDSESTSSHSSKSNSFAPGLPRPESVESNVGSGHLFRVNTMPPMQGSSGNLHDDTAETVNSNKGKLMAMQEKYDALLEQILTKKQQILLLGEACGRTVDLLWGYGARDRINGTNLEAANQIEGDSLDLEWATINNDGGVGVNEDGAFKGPLFGSNVAVWEGPENDLAKLHADGKPCSETYCGPLIGKSPRTLPETQKLAVTMVRMASNLARGNRESSSPPQMNGAGLSANHTVAIESIRKAILLKLDNDEEKQMLKSQLVSCKEELSKLKQQKESYEDLANTLGLLSKNRKYDHQQKKSSEASHRRPSFLIQSSFTSPLTSASGSLGGSEVASRVQGWLNGLTPDLPLSFSEEGKQVATNAANAVSQAITNSNRLQKQEAASTSKRIDLGENANSEVRNGRARLRRKSRRSSHVRKGSLLYDFHHPNDKEFLQGVPTKSQVDEGDRSLGKSTSSAEKGGSDGVSQEKSISTNLNINQRSKSASLPPPPPKAGKISSNQKRRPPRPPSRVETTKVP